ncbi:MAG TPA: hypothetical protein V6D28_06500 [Leptolyngbyaceae cyanobacterium]
MNSRNNACLLCGSSLLRHIRHNEIYWFCSSCHQEVPCLVSLRMPARDTLGQKLRPLTAVSS